jgi:translation elongation factor EF-Ts
MPLSNAERQKRYREKVKQDASKFEEYKRKKHGYYLNTRKPIEFASDREKRKRRRGWRKCQQNRRAKQKQLDEVLNRQLSPCSSNSDIDENVVAPSTSQNDGKPPTSSQSVRLSVHANRQRYVRKLRRAHEFNSKFNTKLKSAQKQCERLKMQLRKSAKKSPQTPRSQADRILSETPSKVRQTLVFHNVLVKELQDVHSKVRCTTKNKQILNKILCGKVLKKYKMLKLARSAFGFQPRQRLRNKNRQDHWCMISGVTTGFRVT